VRARKHLGLDGLERDDPLDPGIVGLVHDAHGATAELAADLVLAELGEFRHRFVSCGSGFSPTQRCARLKPCPRGLPPAAQSVDYLYFESISHTDFWIRRC